MQVTYVTGSIICYMVKDIQPLQLQKIMKTMQKLMKTLQKINETLQFGTSFILCTFSTIIHVLNFHRTPV